MYIREDDRRESNRISCNYLSLCPTAINFLSNQQSAPALIQRLPITTGTFPHSGTTLHNQCTRGEFHRKVGPMTKSESSGDQRSLSAPASTSWQTITSSTSGTPVGNPFPQHQAGAKCKAKVKSRKDRRPTDPEDEFFYEQAKLFRHLERRYNRFVKTTQEDEKRARQGKLKVRKSKDPDDIKIKTPEGRATSESEPPVNGTPVQAQRPQ